MEVEETRGYGVSYSDAIANWTPEFKKRIEDVSFGIVMKELTPLQKAKVMFNFYKEKNRMSKVDISDIRAKGMTCQKFIDQQITYLALFSAIAKTLDTNRAQEIMCKVMDATANDVLLNNMPEIDVVKQFGDVQKFFQKFGAKISEVNKESGCMDVTINDESVKITYCVWLELARKMGMFEAANVTCYGCQLPYPEYYGALGLKYTLKGTLEQGNNCCDIAISKN